MAYRYVADNAAVKALRTEPCSSITDANLTNAITDAETKVDQYLGKRGITVPITGAAITGDLKEAVAVMACAVIYFSNGLDAKGSDVELEADRILDKYIASVDVNLDAPTEQPETFNYQKEFVEDWNEPADAADNMDE